MTLSFLNKATLTIASLIALGIGSAILLAPQAFYALSAVNLPDDVNLLNDIRAFGGGLAAAGLFVGLGALSRWLTLPSLVAATLIYGGFGLARVWAISADGLPGSTYVTVLIIELVVATLCGVLAIRLVWTPRMKGVQPAT